MLYVSSDISNYLKFRSQIEGDFIDLSKIPSSELANECDSIVDHHSKCSVFLGYLESGWMLEPSHQTRIRKLIRKFDVYLVSYFPESLPFSWKNEIDVFYTVNQYGNSNSVNNGSSLQDESNSKHNNSC